jgi:hypothetical protein
MQRHGVARLGRFPDVASQAAPPELRQAHADISDTVCSIVVGFKWLPIHLIGPA